MPDLYAASLAGDRILRWPRTLVPRRSTHDPDRLAARRRAGDRGPPGEHHRRPVRPRHAQTARRRGLAARSVAGARVDNGVGERVARGTPRAESDGSATWDSNNMDGARPAIPAASFTSGLRWMACAPARTTGRTAWMRGRICRTRICCWVTVSNPKGGTHGTDRRGHDLRARHGNGRELGIPLIPQIINFGEDSFREGVEMDNAAFMARLLAGKELPKLPRLTPATSLQHSLI